MNPFAEPFKDKVAAITGAGSGIGRALAVELARQGASVAVGDRDADALADLRRQLDTLGASSMATTLDVTDLDAVRAWVTAVHARFGVVHQLYNIAGIAHVGPVTSAGYDELRRVMDTNFWGAVYPTREFLPHLADSGDGQIVTVSSIFGLVAAPWLSGYDASKFAIRGFTESLRAELLAQRLPVRVMVVHPGGVRTPIMRNSTASPGEGKSALDTAFDLLTITSPEGAARAILRGVRLRRPKLLIGPDARLVDLAQRIGGSAYERVASLAARHLLPSSNV
ncbi:MAG: SDR family NAD(P)-dependent oxidoreductase [Jatrophihabitans sp.]|uniref:SDR family NAD(P)-dependent oxidoreductase n=1 Tax=Jatrophihabitans sp. TaxID=1932789 RepID=UPI003F81B67A